MINVHVGRIGGCLRALALHILGIPENTTNESSIKSIYAEGERLEELVIKKLGKKGYDLETGYQYEKKVRINGTKIEIIGTPDAVRLPSNTPVEIKTMNKWRFNAVPDDFETWDDKLKFKYSYQMKGYTYLLSSKNILWVIKEKLKKGESHGRLLIKSISIDELPSTESLLKRIQLGMEILNGIEVLPENFRDCRYCNYGGEKCMTKYSTKTLDKIEKEDREYFKRMKNLNKDLEDLEEEWKELRIRTEKYNRLYHLKYGRWEEKD